MLASTECCESPLEKRVSINELSGRRNSGAKVTKSLSRRGTDAGPTQTKQSSLAESDQMNIVRRYRNEEAGPERAFPGYSGHSR
jgi:hypothetical protein